MKKELKNILLVCSIIIFNLFVYSVGRAFPDRATIIGTNLDLKIPYIKYFIYFYVSWYFFIFIIPYFIARFDKKSFKEYYLMMIISLFITLIIYIVFPTEMIRTNLDLIGNGITDKIVLLVYKNGSVNACLPSLHVLLSMGYMMPLFNNNKMPKWLKYLGFISGFGIIISTLFVKQHLIYDLIASIVIVIFAYEISKKKLGGNVANKKKIIIKVLYFIIIVLLAIFAYNSIKTCVVYNERYIFYSAPLYAYILAYALEYVLPSIILYIVIRILKRKK